MLQEVRKALKSPLVFVGGGLVTVLLVALLVWVVLATPLNTRLPVPSLDGKYFAYFHPVGNAFMGERNVFDIVVSTPGGRMRARFPMKPGVIFWSNGDDLAVARGEGSEATVISNDGTRFLILTHLKLRKYAEPKWSPSGTKLAFLRPASEGGGIGVYDLEQTQSSAIPFSPEFHLRDAALLFWSPSGEDLYFLESEAAEVALECVHTLTGKVRSLAIGDEGWRLPTRLPQLSPNGAAIFLHDPVRAVVDSKTGKILWSLPGGAHALVLPWSADSRRFYYTMRERPSKIYAHDFGNTSDREALSGVPPKGFFSANGRTYFSRARSKWQMPTSESFGDWIENRWGWQRVDVQTQFTQPLGRLELWPWEVTREGKILASSDEYSQNRPGLYAPDSRVMSEYVFPTAREDVLRQVELHAVTLLTLLFYGLLGFFVYLKRPKSSPGRALAVLCFLLMTLFALADSTGAMATIQWQSSPYPKNPLIALCGYGWEAGYTSPAFRVGESYFQDAMTLLLCLLPLALLHFVLVFPEGNRFLAGRKDVKAALYGATLVPSFALGVLQTDQAMSQMPRMVLFALVYLSGVPVIATAVLALLHNYRHPVDRRAKSQVRWVTMSLALPFVGISGLWILSLAFDHLFSAGSHRFPDVFSAASLGILFLLSAVALAYALIACKLFDIKLLIRRSVRYLLLALWVVAIFLLLVGGLSWTIAGSLANPSSPIIITSTLVTAAILVPTRRRMESIIDRTFDRANYDFRQTLQTFAVSLPQMLDRRALESRMSETVRRSMKCRRFYLFVIDDQTGKLRLPIAPGRPKPQFAEIEFDPAESLCQYLVEQSCPLEVEVSPYNAKLSSILSSARDRLERLGAAVVFGLVRRGELNGLMTVGTKDSQEFYNWEDLALLKTVANQAAIAIENTGLFEDAAQGHEIKKEPAAASEVQRHLLPSLIPQLVTCQVAGRRAPARSVSGDYYDFFELAGRKIGMAMGDVSAKGLAASLLMANLQELLRTHAPATEDLSELVRRINHHVYGSSRGAKYCAFFYGVFDADHFSFDFVNAGHNPPLLLQTGKSRFLEATGIPLGLFADAAHEVRREALEPGARLLLYSDGITEARNSNGEFFGVDRLVRSLAGGDDLDAADIVERILVDVHHFSGNAPIEDDQTLVLLKLKTKRQ